MERRIITQDDAVVNLNNIIRLSVERGEIADEIKCPLCQDKRNKIYRDG